MKDSPRFWLADVEEIKRGYIYDPKTENYICLVCGTPFTRGIIYPIDDYLADAERAVQQHLKSQHQSMFEYLLGMDKKYTGLTDHQKEVLRLFHQGLNDRDIAERLNTGSNSTIRNHRFSFREKEKTAKVFLAIMGLLKEYDTDEPRKRTLKSVPGTRSEEDKILMVYFKEGLDGTLTRLPKKAQQRLVILRHLANRFDPEQEYTEKEVNQTLREAYHDHVTLRRHLVDYGLLDRLPDGSRYWVKTEQSDQNLKGRDLALEHKRLKREYQQNPLPGGVYQIKNVVNGKILVASSANLGGSINRSRSELDRGMHRNFELQQDWDQFGSDCFSFEILEPLEPDNDTVNDFRKVIKAAEERWLEKLKPYAGQGYNHESKP